MYFLAYILLILLTIPYALWGVYLLRRRIVYNEEFSTGLEGGTLAGVAAYLTLTTLLLGLWTQQDTVLIIFAVLGLVVSAFALYGHVGISLSSRLLVDMFFDTRDRALDKPRFSAAEALVQVGDYESALQEYLVIARMYPKHPEVYVRIAETLLLLERKQEAVRWFERALRHAKSAEKSLPILYRLVNVLEQDIGDREAGAEVIESFLHRYPDTTTREQLQARKEGLLMAESEEASTTPTGLDSLQDNPLDHSAEVDPAPLGAALHPKWRLQPQIEAPIAPEGEKSTESEALSASEVARSGVAPIEEPLIALHAAEDASQEARASQQDIGLDALNNYPLSPEQHRADTPVEPDEQETADES